MNKVVNITKWTVRELIELSEELQSSGSRYKTIRRWMIDKCGIDWDEKKVFVELYEYLKATMYFDDTLKCWLDV